MTDNFLIQLWWYHFTSAWSCWWFQSNAIPLSMICIFSLTALKIFLFSLGFWSFIIMYLVYLCFYLLGVCFLVSFGSLISSRKFIAIIFSNLFLPNYLLYPLRILMACFRHYYYIFLLLAQFFDSTFYFFKCSLCV